MPYISWPGLVQPETAPVTFHRKGNSLELHSETDGASIACQIEGEDDLAHWKLYYSPIEPDGS